MNLTRDRLQSIGWFTLLALCTVLTGALVLRVNAVKSQVQISERQIIALKREKQFLETEYETRANQQQLSSINDLDFGYRAPEAGQYLENERQLAVLGKPRALDAPQPIEVANADGDGDDHSALGAIGAQLSGKLVSKAMAAEVHGAGADGLAPARPAHGPLTAASLRERLSRVDPPAARE